MGDMNHRIRDARRKAGMTQAVLAAAAGISQCQLSRIERGVAPVTVERLEAIAAALKVRAARLLVDRPGRLPDQAC